MKRKTLSIITCLSLVLVTCVFCASASAQSAELKIGFVDLQRVIDSSAEGKQAQEEIRKRADELGQRAKEMQEAMQAMKADYDKQFDVLTPEAKGQKRDEISKLERDYTRFVNDSQSELRQIEQRALKQLLENVGKLVLEYGKQENFTLILEAGNILYGIEQIEITEDVIELYNSKKE
ncbi:MAG: OmpH family outer membrane protein [bacterium]|nr:OmpH family outer membrane protein [bacterium]